jgi:carbon monoxide dehydrogenase subunit G
VKLEGRITIAAVPATTWALVTNPVALAACVPGVREVRQIDDRTFAGSITASVGPMDGDFDFTAVIAVADFPDRLDVEITGLDSVTSSRLEATVHASLAAEDPGSTILAYRADVRVKGRLGILGEMVLRATASMMITQVTKCLRSRLETGAPIADASGEPGN